MSYLEKLVNKIKDLNQVRPSEFDGLIWNERVKGSFHNATGLKKVVSDAIKGEYLIYQCNSCRLYFRHSTSLGTFNDELDGCECIRCKPCSKHFKKAKRGSKVIVDSILINAGVIKR